MIGIVLRDGDVSRLVYRTGIMAQEAPGRGIVKPFILAAYARSPFRFSAARLCAAAFSIQGLRSK